MDVDYVANAYGGVNNAYVSPIVFTDHTAPDLGTVRNETYHYENVNLGAGSCIEVLHEDICGATADIKLEALGVYAGNHVESMANTPVRIINFFADDNLDADKIAQLQGSWAESNFDLLTFLRKYAISTAFHNSSTHKYFTAFDRNLLIQNANTLSNEENFAKRYYRMPYNRMSFQGMRVFEPIRNVFGHQTGNDAANNPFIFKSGYEQNVNDSDFLYEHVFGYFVEDDTDPNSEFFVWIKDWASAIPANGNGEHVTAEVAEWLWNHFIGDGGKNFDSIARAQVHALLAQGRDFAYTVDSGNSTAVFSSTQIEGADIGAATTDQANASTPLDLTDDDQKKWVGMAINFITMTPYAFAMEGQ
jgi:hypothetical protein